jgi:hypothetical protein
MKAFHVRQGDVMLVRVDAVPAKAKVTAKGNLVLAEGEVTGHAHRIVDDGAVMLTTAESATFVRLARKVQLVHEEHGAITLDPGTYRVVRQREFTDDLEPRRVAD